MLSIQTVRDVGPARRRFARAARNSGGTPSGTQSVFTNNYNTTTFLNPHGLAVDSSGNVYLADSASGSFAGAIYEFSSGGSAVNYDTNFNEITNGSGGPFSPYGLQVDANGNLFGTIKSRIYGTQTVYEVSLNGGSSTLSPLYSSAQGGTNGNDMFYYFAFNNAPEPSSLCLLGLGGLTLLARRRRA